ncbi:hypothetical protein ACFP1I_04465 [Dyadobacter subterraneus]|uniref:Thioredoxin domain-containing protein n=1 Tax=Dyadobacter subterraneus TaxID=2773304 RepID=A0ABR9WGI8_9BACT|nr:hypothetical protein [Dyadobacter subterraneus]MBE9464615.1 hypothetical protein [Dyadobacter subterraneus]
MRTKLPLIILVIFLCTSYSGFAATDSLIIKGRILNLTGRLYRQAPSITFSRNNILQPQSELSKQAPLQADGSFRVSLPILFSSEEIYLDYSGKAFTTFLGSPGEIEITFNGDSIAKAKKLFYFAGVNATANNLYPQYLASLNNALASNSVLGTKFYETYWDKTFPEAQKAASARAELRVSALLQTSNSVPDKALTQWVQSIAEDERYQNLYEYLLSNQLDVPKSDSWLIDLKKLTKAPLTAQHVSLADRISSYADLKKQLWANGASPKVNSLQVRLMGTMIKNNTPGLTDDETEKLDAIIDRGKAEKIEMDFLNNLYKKNTALLDLLFAYEAESRFNHTQFDSTGSDFLNARYLPKNFYKFSYKNQLNLNKYIQTRLISPQFRQSLDEIVRLEVKDSVNINKMISFANLKATPTEVLPEYWLAESDSRGNAWFNSITEQYKGKTLYILKWNIEDQKSRDDLEYAASLRAQLPTDVEFIYLHLPMDENPVSYDLVKQYIVRHQLKGVHMFINSNQIIDLLIRLNPLDSGSYAIIKPNGKFETKKAPSPAQTELVLKAIREARN